MNNWEMEPSCVSHPNEMNLHLCAGRGSASTVILSSFLRKSLGNKVILSYLLSSIFSLCVLINRMLFLQENCEKIENHGSLVFCYIGNGEMNNLFESILFHLTEE